MSDIRFEVPVRDGMIGRLTRACRGRHALPAFGAISFLESSLVPVPIDLAMVPLGLAQPKRIWLIALVGAIGSLLGALFGYAIGALAFESVGRWVIDIYGLEEAYVDLQGVFLENSILAIVVAGLTPIPFKLAAIASGAFGMPLASFIATAFVVRLVRFMLMAIMVRVFGRGLDILMTRYGRSFTLIAVAAAVLAMVATPLLI